LIWPEHAARRRMAEAAIALLLRDPPRLVKGDATQVLEAQLNDVPPETLLVVYNSAALCQGGVADQHAVRSALETFRCTGSTVKTKKCCCARWTPAT
jgi:hypothetical protein